MALLIYGANGYTGELVARRAAAAGTRAVLAGRNAHAVATLAAELGRDHRAVALDDAAALDRALSGMTVVLNCAGPFSRTAAPLVAACLRARAHYLDITGEIAVLEEVAGRDAEARAARVTLLPGAGFDVVPSDCLAAHVARRLPSATHLALAFSAGTRMSRGTALTTIENAHRGGLVRRAGQLTHVPSGWRSRRIDFGPELGARTAITIPWGDVATAYHTTGIPNVEVYAAVPLAVRTGLRAARALGPLLASAAVKRALEARVRRGPAGPTAAERAQRTSHLWAEARDAAGQVAAARLRTPESYELTSMTALDLAARALRGELPAGFQTPARACGPDYVLQFPGVAREDVPLGH
ncbi:MAG TPA: saccharopine dehydrogenase NADP-binding domain-containing protein [Polyangia bacterium]|jgi:short subunit dehydrogenase-like uncharacterized protein|nr:saccharopine dehydrogenase NADP-binding domain-containing protein [Polyangia bacterium]